MSQGKGTDLCIRFIGVGDCQWSELGTMGSSDVLLEVEVVRCCCVPVCQQVMMMHCCPMSVRRAKVGQTFCCPPAFVVISPHRQSLRAYGGPIKDSVEN